MSADDATRVVPPRKEPVFKKDKADASTEPVKLDDDEQVALITGCASGIGLGTALALAGLNYRLVLVDKNTERLAEAAQMCAQKSPKGHKVSFWY